MLHEIMVALNHSYVDVLKVDIEGEPASHSLVRYLPHPLYQPPPPISTPSSYPPLSRRLIFVFEGWEHPWIRAEPLAVFRRVGNAITQP